MVENEDIKLITEEDFKIMGIVKNNEDSNEYFIKKFTKLSKIS